MATDPDWSPSDVVSHEELLDVDAIGYETFKLDGVHVHGVREYDQLYVDICISYNTQTLY